MGLGSAACAEDYLVWALRDHYSFSSDHATLSYDVKRAEWKVDVPGLGVVVKDVKAEVVFTDGARVFLSDLEPDIDTRDEFSGPLGTGKVFTSTFKKHKGLAISCSVRRFDERPFLLMRIEAKNTGGEIIGIERIRPAVVAPGGIGNFSTMPKVTAINMDQRAKYPVPHREQRASLVSFELAGRKTTIAVGILQSGHMDSSIRLDPSGGSWQGSVECVFDPPLLLQPGETVQADPVWVSFGTPDLARVLQFFSWSKSVQPSPSQGDAIPDSWVTVEKGDNADTLYGVARDWTRSGVRHALVPSMWEGRPGSLKGAVPNYPRDMGQVADTLSGIGMKPGITVDPLKIARGAAEWTALTDDGARWLNPSIPKGREAAIERLKGLVAMGYKFFVVERSLIPNEVLRHFNMTRAEADLLAFDMMAGAAAGRPVLPSSALRLRHDDAHWTSMAASTAWLEEYQVAAGPVRIVTDGMKEVSPTLADALREFAGPVEIVGSPKSRLRNQLGEILSAPAKTHAGS
jgi:hypothetical protein